MQKLTAFIAAIMLATPAAADLAADGVALLFGSYHAGATQDFEESNPGVFLIWDGDIVDTRVGCYSNSFGDPSCAVTWASDYVSLSAGGFNAHAFAGAAYYSSGAEGSPIKLGEGNIVPMVGVEFTHDDLPVFVQVMPGDEELMGFDYLVTAGVQWAF